MARARIQEHELQSFNPVSGEALGTVPRTAPEAVPALVERCAAAQRAWADTPLAERGRCLKAALDDLLAEGDALVDLTVAETGQCEAATRFNQMYETAGLFRWHLAELPALLQPRPLPVSGLDQPGAKAWVDRAPLGVVGLITPWNYAYSIPLRSLVPALLCGNGVIFKPSEHTALVGQRVAEIVQRHLPADLLLVAHGAGDTGAALCAADGVEAVFFTGSVRAGKAVAAACAARLAHAHLELGGKDAALVLADADLDRSAMAIAWGAFNNTGQDCSSVERVYVEAPVFDAFAERVARIAGALRGPGSGASAWDIGPFITEEQAQVYQGQMLAARDAGARLLAGAWPEELPLQPVASVVTDLPDDCALLREETFGPVLPLVKVADPEAGLRAVNDSPYRLGASVWTADLARGEALSRRFNTGVTNVNASSWVATVPGSVWGGPGLTGGGATGGPGMVDAMTRSVSRTRVSSKALAPNWMPLDDTATEMSRLRNHQDRPGIGNFLTSLVGLGGRLGKRTAALKKILG